MGPWNREGEPMRDVGLFGWWLNFCSLIGNPEVITFEIELKGITSPIGYEG